MALERGVYQGGHFRLESAVAAAPDVRLHLTAPEPFDATPGRVLHVDIADGWVIPGSGS